MTATYTARRLLVRSSLLGLASAGALACGAASATDAIDVRLRQAMQRDLGISAKQLPQYLQTERLSLQRGGAAKRALGSTYAGSWIERKANGRYQFVVASSGTGKAARDLGGVEVRNVRHSLRQLENAFSALEAHAGSRVAGVSKPLSGVHSWRVDPLTNSVVVSVAPGADTDAIDFVAFSGADASAVRFETEHNTPQLLAEVVGGIEYSWPVMVEGQKRYGVCSVGFPVTKGTARGFATAGHCGAAGVAVNVGPRADEIPLGTFTASNFPGNDMAWVTINADHTLAGKVTDYNSGSVAVKGSTEAAIGAAVCRSGRTTFYKCGTVRAKNVSVNYGLFSRVTGLTESTACAGGGDSGGSWITPQGQAQGVTSGGNVKSDTKENCTLAEAQRRTWFQPLNPLLTKYGLTLVTN
ncbi:S1 family peptidase [Lysobacter sp. CA199]|uniref:S1 family peptidase n=1 Tax=Lysobacter sp. CA199 TaxID=3455608 RepID=UPI003F8D8F13